MKKIGVLLTARPGGGQFQYSQSSLEASYGVDPSKVFVLPFIAPRYIYDNDSAPKAGVVERRPSRRSRWDARWRLRASIGIPDQLRDAALLFDPHSVDEIHECLVRLWTDDRLCATLAERGRRHTQQWGPPQFNDRLREVIDALT